jgi:hypothetical protein
MFGCLGAGVDIALLIWLAWTLGQPQFSASRWKLPFIVSWSEAAFQCISEAAVVYTFTGYPFEATDMHGPAILFLEPK